MIGLAGIQKILTELQMSNKFGRNCGCRHIVAATFLQCAPLPCIIDDSQQHVRECRPREHQFHNKRVHFRLRLLDFQLRAFFENGVSGMFGNDVMFYVICYVA